VQWVLGKEPRRHLNPPEGGGHEDKLVCDAPIPTGVRTATIQHEQRQVVGTLADKVQ
jgi:hypothetical protein